MHDRAARPTGAVKSAAAIAIEIMILLSIDLRIAQVRPRVEESVQLLLMLLRRVVVCAVLSASDAHAPDPPLRQRTLQPPIFVCFSTRFLRGRRLEFISTKRRQT